MSEPKDRERDRTESNDSVLLSPAAPALKITGFVKYGNGLAKRAADKAERAANKQIASIPLDAKEDTCAHCNGTAEMKEKVIVECANRPDKEVEVDVMCVYCTGTGKWTRENEWNNIYRENMWCDCEDESDDHNRVEHADDGYDIFGGDIYVCTVCTGVVQFG